MVKKIMCDSLFLVQKSVDATEADKQVVTDLIDTLRANIERCVGNVLTAALYKKKKGCTRDWVPDGKKTSWSNTMIAKIIRDE